MVKTTNTTNFQSDVLSKQGTVIVDFWAPWCAPCRILGPILEELANDLGGKAEVFKVNVDENQELAYQYGISGIPTVIIFKNGAIQEKIVGVRPKEEYLQYVA